MMPTTPWAPEWICTCRRRNHVIRKERGLQRRTEPQIRKSTPCKVNCCKTSCDQWFLAKALIARITPDSSRRRSATELVGLKVDAIHTVSTPAALAARSATTIIPIVFSGVGDPVGAGLVASLARPGGNATGLSLLATELSGKRLEVLREIIPGISRVAMLWNDTNPGMVLRANETQDAAAKLNVTLQSIGVHDLVDFEPAFKAISDGGAAALLTLVDPFTRVHRKRIVDFAAQRGLPAIYEARQFVDSGGLISYGPNLLALQRRVADYLDKIFRGAKPSDLPVEQPTKFELVINLKTSKALGLEIPPTLIARADEVIE